MFQKVTKCSSEMAAYKSLAGESVTQKTTRESSMYKGSDEYFEYICDPCSTAGDHVEAQGFCTNCEEYLCVMCFRCHSRSKLSRDHVFLDKDNMPKKSVTFCDQCKTAGDEIEAAGYCTDCDEHLCESCYRRHATSEQSKHHVLIDKDNIPRKGEAIASSLAVLNIDKGDVASVNYVEKYTYIRDINVASTDDEKICNIIGITMVSSSELILTDCNNKSLKLVENNVLKSSLKLDANLCGVTMISPDHVAVALPDKCKINILSVSGDLAVVRTVETTGKCLDIQFINGKIYVSFWKPVKYQILQPTGAVYKTIKPDSEVLKHCTLPRHIAVSRDESLLYFSDWQNNKVVCIDMNGKMVSRLNCELNSPSDITISPSGSVYLCNTAQHVVYKATPNLRDATVILGPGDGLSSPYAMCFDADRQIVFISSKSVEKNYCNFIKMYSWK